LHVATVTKYLPLPYKGFNRSEVIVLTNKQSNPNQKTKKEILLKTATSFSRSADECKYLAHATCLDGPRAICFACVNFFLYF